MAAEGEEQDLTAATVASDTAVHKAFAAGAAAAATAAEAAMANEGGPRGNQAHPDTSPVAQLPFGWQRLFCNVQNIPYFLDTANNTTQWEIPTELVDGVTQRSQMAFSHTAEITRPLEPGLEACAEAKASDRNAAFKKGCDDEAARNRRANLLKSATKSVRNDLLNAKRMVATCCEEPSVDAAAAAAAVPVCISMASDASLSDYGDGALHEAQQLLDPTVGEQVFRAGVQHGGPSTVHPTVAEVEVVA